MTIHDFDMARWLAGDITTCSPPGQPGRSGDRRANDIDTPRSRCAAAPGALLQISNSRRSGYGYDQRIEVFGSGGMLLAGNRRATAVESWSAQRTAAQDPVLDFFLERYAHAYEAELEAFVSALEQDAALSPDFGDGLEALRLAAAAAESIRTGRVVELS